MAYVRLKVSIQYGIRVTLLAVKHLKKVPYRTGTTKLKKGVRIMTTVYSNKDAAQINIIKDAVRKLKARKVVALRVRIEDLLVERVTLDKGSYTC
jgi:hypothetical protein